MGKNRRLQRLPRYNWWNVIRPPSFLPTYLPCSMINSSCFCAFGLTISRPWHLHHRRLPIFSLSQTLWWLSVQNGIRVLPFLLTFIVRQIFWGQFYIKCSTIVKYYSRHQAMGNIQVSKTLVLQFIIVVEHLWGWPLGSML